MAKEKNSKQFSQEMSLEEARAYRVSLHKPEDKKLSEEEKREAFRIFWTQQKKKLGVSKNIEKAVWLHLKATNNDSPEKFEEGIKHFGLQKNK